MFALVDCNNFYASCERVFRPELNGKPVVVLSNNDGCIIARSEEAKALGVPMAAPAYQLEKLFAEHEIHVFSSNYPLYGDMSNRVMSLLAEMSPEIEVYSIDEAFLKFEGCQNLDLDQQGRTIRKRVWKSTGLPISIGIAPTKSLSKIANKIAKKYSHIMDGVYCMDTEERRLKALRWLPIGEVWGIGRRHAKRLQQQGVKTAYDFTQMPEQWVLKHMAIVGLRLQKDLLGAPTLDLDEFTEPKKNIATTRSFEHNQGDLPYIKERVATFAVSCAEKLRKQGSHCNALMVFIQTNGHRRDLPQHSRSVVLRLPFPTNSNLELTKFAIQGLQQIFKQGYSYKKAGVIVLDTTPADRAQINLFENTDPRHLSLMHAVDSLNQSIGQQKVKLACQDLDRTWKMRQERLSPRYTTRLEEIITVWA